MKRLLKPIIMVAFVFGLMIVVLGWPQWCSAPMALQQAALIGNDSAKLIETVRDPQIVRRTRTVNYDQVIDRMSKKEAQQATLGLMLLMKAAKS